MHCGQSILVKASTTVYNLDYKHESLAGQSAHHAGGALWKLCISRQPGAASSVSATWHHPPEAGHTVTIIDAPRFSLDLANTLTQIAQSAPMPSASPHPPYR